jgi:hypothetical protein
VPDDAFWGGPDSEGSIASSLRTPGLNEKGAGFLFVGGGSDTR